MQAGAAWRASTSLVVRERTGGIYFGEKTRTARPPPATGRCAAFDTVVYSDEEIRRVDAPVPSGWPRQPPRPGHFSRQGQRAGVFAPVAPGGRRRSAAEEFPDIELEHQLVDSTAMHLLVTRRQFDVIVTENMFGDILTDEAARCWPARSVCRRRPRSASLAPGRVYEPIHGSAPDIAGKGIANPNGTILSAAMLLRHSLGLEAEAAAVEAAVHAALDDGVFTADLAAKGQAVSTTQATGRCAGAVGLMFQSPRLPVYEGGPAVAGVRGRRIPSLGALTKHP